MVCTIEQAYVMTVQGHPRSLTSISAKKHLGAYATSHRWTEMFVLSCSIFAAQDFVLEWAVLSKRVCNNFSKLFLHVASRLPASLHTKWHLDLFTCFCTLQTDAQTDGLQYSNKNWANAHETRENIYELLIANWLS